MGSIDSKKMALIAGLAGLSILGACGSRPDPLQKGIGLELTPTGIGLVGGRNGIAEFYGAGCEKAIASIGTERVRPTTVTRGMTTCDLYELKGHPSSTSSLDFFRSEDEVPSRYTMTYIEDGVKRDYKFRDNLLDKVE